MVGEGIERKVRLKMGPAGKQEPIWWHGVIIAAIKNCRVMREEYDEQTRLQVAPDRSPANRSDRTPVTPSPGKKWPGGRISFGQLDGVEVSSEEEEVAR